jgi:hypothetical protein
MILNLFATLLLASAQPSPYDYDRAPLDGSFGQQLDYYCRGHGAQDQRGWQQLQGLLPHFEDNYGTVLDVIKHAPSDRFLANMVAWINISNLTAAHQHEAFRRIYAYCLEKPDYLETLANLLSQTNALTREETKFHLESDNKYVRLAAEGAMKRLYIRERAASEPRANAPSLPVRGNDGLQAHQASAPDGASSAAVNWGIAGGFLSLFSAIGWLLWSRHRHRIR